MRHRSLCFFRSPKRQTKVKKNQTAPRLRSSNLFYSTSSNKFLPVNRNDFRPVIENNLPFVDKTLFIKDILDNNTRQLEVITLPPGYGKTMNLSMLYHFISGYVDGKETKALFNSLAITHYPDHMAHQGSHLAIFLTFEGIEPDSFHEAKEQIFELFYKLYQEYQYLLDSKKISDRHKYFFEAMLTKRVNSTQLQTALWFLAECIFYHHNGKPWLLVDAYDTPIQAGRKYGYENEITAFISSMFDSALEVNPFFQRAIVMGASGTVKTNALFKVRNLKFHSPFSSNYSRHFGFSEFEVDTLLKKFALSEKLVDVKACHKGHQVDKKAMYEPSLIIQSLGLQKLPGDRMLEIDKSFHCAS